MFVRCTLCIFCFFFFFFQAEDGIRDKLVTGVQTCALPILEADRWMIERMWVVAHKPVAVAAGLGHMGIHRNVIHPRSEEHTSELQSLAYLVCRLLLEKKKINRSSRRFAPRSAGRASSLPRP